MATEHMEMNGDADPNREAEVRERSKGAARDQLMEPLANVQPISAWMVNDECRANGPQRGRSSDDLPSGHHPLTGIRA